MHCYDEYDGVLLLLLRVGVKEFDMFGFWSGLVNLFSSIGNYVWFETELVLLVDDVGAIEAYFARFSLRNLFKLAITSS